VNNINETTKYPGLTSAEAKTLQEKFGKNEPAPVKKTGIIKKLLLVLCEPMFLLLIIAAAVYFFLGEPVDGAVMLVFVLFIIGIDAVQEWKTDKTLAALRDLSAPRVNALRDGKEMEIPAVDLVPGDIIMIREGGKVPADGYIIKCSDLLIDESMLTGESEGVWKTPYNEVSDGGAPETADYWKKDYCYAGTLVAQGTGTVCVEKTGAATEYGKIHAGVAKAPKDKTPLQKQINGIVKLFVGIAAVLIALVATVTWFNLSGNDVKSRLVQSVLSGVTLAMAMIPEEFPVILTVFLAMGAWRLGKKKTLVRRLPAVETLGAVSVLCVDKTGTITMNQMAVRETWAADGNEENLCETMGLACETDAYDPMEKAMLTYCERMGIRKTHLFGGDLISEYAFTNELKMMGHVWRHDGEIIIAAKGSPEKILTICALSDGELAAIEDKAAELSGRGLRVIAVASSSLLKRTDAPEEITDCTLTFCGLVGLADPPRESVKEDIAVCYKAGIRVVMITGDNGATAAAIAEQIGMKDYDNVVTGDMLNSMSDGDLRERVKSANIFSRVVPEHKTRIVKAFRYNGETVAMTGDGVNDAPALKHADIGIAMGKRGSEAAREAAGLVLMDDNFSVIVDTVKDGRRIYDNIRKAVGYVLTIHIPIALISLIAPLLSIPAAGLMLLPLHIVLLELIVDPTCSVVLERQPAETNIMRRAPRKCNEPLLNVKTAMKNVVLGLVVFAASFGVYYYIHATNPAAETEARSMGLAVLMLANLFLVWVISSDTDSVITSFKRLRKDKVMWAVNILTVAGLLIILYTPLNSVLGLSPLAAGQFFTALVSAAASDLWWEAVKVIKRARGKKVKSER